MLILTHCYPESPTDNSGIWLKRSFDGFPVMKISKWGMTPRNVAALRRGKGLIIACWVIPAGFLAYLSGRPYVMYCLGLDCFWVERSRLVALLFRPILDRACKLVFSSRRLHDAMNSGYGDRYLAKSQVIHLPVNADEFHPA
jgi:hypothetical protein